MHGGNTRTCNVILKNPIPAQVKDNLMLLDGWAQKSVMGIGFDMKHSQRWPCEICEEPARDVLFDPRPSLQPENPIVMLDIHHLCEARSGPCHTAVHESVRQRALAMGIPVPPPLPPASKSTAQSQASPASSCAKCQRESTSENGKMMRCSRCKLTRYCSVDCHAQDWARHGKTCKMIQSVTWSGFPDPTDPTPTKQNEITFGMPGAFK
uniref:MYND-type domain-containing protein n=1 Tax=Mycena chlorophos TaxID=658473 RepID=A0ABQ0LDK6_MYCCL|nr:predicted protein [Mycena chlorophos]